MYTELTDAYTRYATDSSVKGLFLINDDCVIGFEHLSKHAKKSDIWVTEPALHSCHELFNITEMGWHFRPPVMETLRAVFPRLRTIGAPVDGTRASLSDVFYFPKSVMPRAMQLFTVFLHATTGARNDMMHEIVVPTVADLIEKESRGLTAADACDMPASDPWDLPESIYCPHKADVPPRVGQHFFNGVVLWAGDLDSWYDHYSSSVDFVHAVKFSKLSSRYRYRQVLDSETGSDN